MMITIKQITEQDAAAISILSLQFGYTVSTEDMQRRVAQVLAKEDHCGFVALSGNQVVGWIHGFYTFRLESAPFVEIGGLVVDADFRRQGIGQQLVEQVKAWATEKSVGKVRVRCNTKRLDTHKFYLQAGFTESKEQKVFDFNL